MKIAVCVKQVPDTETKIKLAEGGKGVDTGAIKWVLNPYDEFAVEEAIKIKEKTPGAQVFVFTIGPKKRAGEALRTCLAMGADEASLIHSDEDLGHKSIAKLLATAIKKAGPFNLIFAGKLAIDDNSSVVGPMLAECLNLPLVTSVTKLEKMADNHWAIECDSDGGIKQRLEAKGEALVLTATKGLNTPRFASLPGIMKAKKKTILEMDATSLAAEASFSLQAELLTLGVRLPSEKPPVKMLSGEPSAQVSELVQLLRNEAKAL